MCGVREEGCGRRNGRVQEAGSAAIGWQKIHYNSEDGPIGRWARSVIAVHNTGRQMMVP